MQVSGYFGCKENPWTVMMCINPTHLICEHNSHRLWGGYWAIWRWCASLPQIRQEERGYVMNFTLSHEYPSLLHEMGRGERWQLPRKETKSKEAYRIIGLFSSHQGGSAWDRSPTRYTQTYLKYWLKQLIETYLVDMHELYFGASIWVEVLPWAFYGVLPSKVCLGQQIIVRNIKCLVPSYEIFTAWLYFSSSVFNKNCNSPAQVLEPHCKIKAIRKDKRQ